MKRRRGRGIAKLVGFAITVILIVILAFAAVTALRIYQVTNHSHAATEQSERFIEALKSDPDSAQQHLDAARDEIAQTGEALNAVPLAQLGAVPWVECNITAVNTLLDEVDGLLADEGSTLIGVADLVNLESGELREGFSSVFELLDSADQIKDTIVAVPDAIDHLKEARDAVGGIETSGLLEQVATSVDDTYRALDDAYTMVSPLQATAEDIASRYETAGQLGALHLALQLLS